jgi:hypothetical protein
VVIKDGIKSFTSGENEMGGGEYGSLYNKWYTICCGCGVKRGRFHRIDI